MQNLYCRNVLNVKFPKIVAEKFAFYTQDNVSILRTASVIGNVSLSKVKGFTLADRMRAAAIAAFCCTEGIVNAIMSPANSKRGRKIRHAMTMITDLSIFLEDIQKLFKTGSYDITSTFMAISSRGRSLLSVAASCIWPTISSPDSTSPNTVYWPSRNGVPPSVEYASF